MTMMKTTDLKNLAGKPLVLGAVAVTLTCISMLPAWTPPDPESNGENVDIPAGGVNATGPLVSTRYNDLANSVAFTPAVVAGKGNDLMRTGSASDLGRGLVVGISNKLSCVSSTDSVYSAIIGGTNDVRAMSSIIVGNNNDVASGATSVLTSARFTNVFGLYNTIQPGSYGSLVSGGYNTVRADYSLVAGQGNTVEGSTVGSRTMVSAAIGGTNHVMSNNSWTIGSGNEVSSDLTLGFGCGLIADSMGCTFLGEFNQPVDGSLNTREEEDPVLVVGNGVDSNNRSNALVVKRNGDIVITKPQGDISMGIYE